MQGHRGYVWLLALGALIASLAVPVSVSAHLERPSYWPDPAPDTSVSPPAGGEVPSARTLASAFARKAPGKLRVVCEGRKGRTSLALLKRSIADARTNGFEIRPSQPKLKLSKKQAKRLANQNRKLR